MKNLSKFSKLSPTDKGLYYEALITSIKVKLMVTCLPLRWYASYLGKQHLVTAENNIENSYSMIFRISQAIVRSQKTVPWPTRCLVNAITAKVMLREKGLESTLYLGVRKENEKMTAHAWLRCGTFFVTGRRGMENFTIVSTFV
jgi:hypothetical protein